VSVLAALFVGTLLTSVTPGCGGTEPPRVRNASVVRVDARSGRVEAVVPVGVDPLQLVVAARQVWTMEFGQGTLSRIDPASNKAAAIDIGQAAGMASDGEDIWVAANGNTLVRLDGESGKRQRVLKLASKPFFELRDAGFLTVSSGSIWLTIPVLGDNSAESRRRSLCLGRQHRRREGHSGRGRDEYREERRRKHRSGRRCHRSRVALG
jgi:streptogramin lyase